MRILSILSVLLLSIQCAGQSYTGIIAHWKFNGNANDSSGNGHNGHMYNITPAAGKDGVMGHGYYFNGVDSKITVPYTSTLNLTKFSICATVKVQGFYSGTCTANTILLRGKSGGGIGTYNLYFSDLPSNAGCTSFDSSLEVFTGGAGEFSATATAFDYTPHIVKDVWYSVVTTFNDTTYKVYINGVLKSSVPVTVPGPISSSTDSIGIGFNVYEPAYPYPFKGVMDDIRLYNRVLNDTEVTTYSTGTLAANQLVQTPGLSLFPNPVKETITLSLDGWKIDNAILKVFDVTGQQVVKQEINNASTVIDVSRLSTGMYFITVVNDEGILTSKFIKE